MSDSPQGPGWWQASDGKWYPPEQHPDYQQPTQPVAPTESEPPPEPQPTTVDAPPTTQGPTFHSPPTYASPPLGGVPPSEPPADTSAASTEPSRPNRTPLFVALAVGVVLLLGAGAFLLVRDNDSNSTSSFCSTVAQIKDAGAGALTNPSDPRSLQTAVNQLNRLASSAPSQIKSDVQTLQAFFQQLVTAKASAGEDEAAQARAVLKVLGNADRARIEQAGRNIERFVRTNCGTTLDLSQSLESSLSDFGSDFGTDFFSDFGSDFGSDFFSDFGSDFGSDFQSSLSSFFSDFESIFSDPFSESNTPRQSS